MKRFVGLLLLFIIGFSVYWFVFKSKKKSDDGPKMAPLALKKHSDSFNANVDKMVGAYLDIKNAFIEDDSVKAKESTKTFISLLDSIPLQELKNDTASIFQTAQSNVNDIKANANSLIAQTTISEMRHDFSMVTDMMYPSFFKAINYEGQNIYLQNCPMAFGDDQPANWISNSNEVVNPYLGKHHPEYKATMLHCGSVKDSIKGK
ncbi:MAG: DUF3347 domain-containing protein [Ferruginibacter sp.]